MRYYPLGRQLRCKLIDPFRVNDQHDRGVDIDRLSNLRPTMYHEKASHGTRDADYDMLVQ
jgi:hypothetical protein